MNNSELKKNKDLVRSRTYHATKHPPIGVEYGKECTASTGSSLIGRTFDDIEKQYEHNIFVDHYHPLNERLIENTRIIRPAPKSADLAAFLATKIVPSLCFRVCGSLFKVKEFLINAD